MNIPSNFPDFIGIKIKFIPENGITQLIFIAYKIDAPWSSKISSGKIW